MTTKLIAAVGHSDDIDIEVVATELIEACSKQLNGVEPQAGMLFTGIALDHQTLLNKLNETWPEIHLIGCTTDGEFSSVAGTKQDSAVLVLLHSNKLAFTSGVLDQSDTETQTTQLISAASRSELSPALGLMLADGLNSNCESAITATQNAFGRNFPLFGALAADQWQFTATKQFYQDRIVTDQSPFLLIHGDLNVASAVSQDWLPMSEPAVVTKAQGNELLEINGKSTKSFFQEEFKEALLPNAINPIAIYSEKGEFQYLRSSYQSSDNEALTLSGTITAGEQVRLTVVNRSALLKGAEHAAQQAISRYPSKKPKLAICFSGCARRAYLGSQCQLELETIQQKLSKNTPIIGFYSSGEIAPKHIQTESQLLNQSLTIALIG